MGQLKIILSPSSRIYIDKKNGSQQSYCPSVGGWAKGEEFRQEESQGIQAQIKGDAVSECDTRCSQGVTPNAGYKCRNRVSDQSEGMETWTSPEEVAEEEKKDVSLAGPGIMDQGESERLVPEMILKDVCL